MSGSQTIPGTEYPVDYAEAQQEEDARHRDTELHANVGVFIEAPAESANQINNRIEKRYRLPRGWQHAD